MLENNIFKECFVIDDKFCTQLGGVFKWFIFVANLYCWYNLADLLSINKWRTTLQAPNDYFHWRYRRKSRRAQRELLSFHFIHLVFLVCIMFVWLGTGIIILLKLCRERIKEHNKLNCSVKEWRYSFELTDSLSPGRNHNVLHLHWSCVITTFSTWAMNVFGIASSWTSSSIHFR